MNIDALRAHYNTNVDWLGRVVSTLRDVMGEARRLFIQQFPDVGHPKPPEVRVKEFSRLVGKIHRKPPDWAHDEIFAVDETGTATTIFNDVVGGRIVCATQSDVRHLAEIIRQSEAMSDAVVDLKHVPETGYRGCHIDARVMVLRGQKYVRFPVEIQVKTLIQDAWANFGHPEFYKPDEDPPLIAKEVAQYLADVLDGIDKIGQAIRDEKHRKKPGPFTIEADETHVTRRTLRFLLTQQMGNRGVLFEGLSDLEIEQCIQQLRAYGYDNLAMVSAIIEDQKVDGEIQIAKAEVGIRTLTTPFELLYFGPVTVKEDASTLQRELRRYYGFTEQRCARCAAPITQDQKSFIEQKTDLDTKVLCDLCCQRYLAKCERCARLTESGCCKNCRSHEESLEIV